MSFSFKPLLVSLAIATLAGCGHMPTVASVRAAQGIATRAVPATYYQKAEGQTGQALLTALHGICINHKDLGYDGARMAMFSDIDDPNNSNTVEDIYLGKVFTNVSNTNTAYQGGNGLNAEHTWPQSKGATGPAKADLHHLFPAEVHANSTRSSFPFGVVKTATWSEGGSKLGTNADGVTVFEPRDEHKGDTARAILYFYMMYASNGGHADTSNFRVEQATMAAWSQADPVTPAEAKRNDAIFVAQGNRNPFVDHPEWVAAVGQFMK